MSMFCYQCQETGRNTGCTVRGVCGKDETTAKLQDALIYTLKGIGIVHKSGDLADEDVIEAGRFVTEALFTTITNANFDPEAIAPRISSGLGLRDALAKKAGINQSSLPDAASWKGAGRDDFEKKAAQIGVLAEDNEDIRSLKELTIYGMKGIAAYAAHAKTLGYEDVLLYRFVLEALAKTTEDLTVDELIALVMETGKYGVEVMKLLDAANTETYGNPELTKVSLGARGNPGILVSGHDLKDMQELLEQTKGTGVDVYTHGEMLPAHGYPAFKKYEHLAGNYGGSWWKQNRPDDKAKRPFLRVWAPNLGAPPDRRFYAERNPFTRRRSACSQECQKHLTIYSHRPCTVYSPVNVSSSKYRYLSLTP